MNKGRLEAFSDGLMAGAASRILVLLIIAQQGEGSRLASLVGGDLKGKLSLVLYAAAIPLAFVLSVVSDCLYVAVAPMWLVPDRRIESRLRG